MRNHHPSDSPYLLTRRQTTDTTASTAADRGLTAEQLDALRARYSPATPSPCPVCGGPLAVLPGDHDEDEGVVWACPPPPEAGWLDWRMHHQVSRWVQHLGDPDVIALLDEVEQLRQKGGAQ